MPSSRPGANEVHVWWLHLRSDAAADSRAWTVLSPDERTNARRLKVDSDRSVHVRGRACLRRVLGDCLGAPAAEVTIVTGEHGKPALAGTAAADALHFNVSHSGVLVVIAVTAIGEVGIDVERIDDALDWSDIAERFLSPVELRAIDRLPQPDQRPAFFACWVRKEAYLKGIGTGFQRETNNFTVPVAGQGGAVVDGSLPSPAISDPWHVHRLDIDAQYAAAVAVRGAVALTVRSWSDADPGTTSGARRRD